jgi:hypothetical protein
VNTPPVYTYFGAVPELPIDERLLQIEAWRASWRRYGWRPVVLGLNMLSRHPDAKLAAEVIAQRPTVNPPQYTMNTSLRWFAFAAAGGGLTTDCDVVNIGLTPAGLAEAMGDCNCATLCGEKGLWVPAAVYATAIGAHKLTSAILFHPLTETFEVRGQPHISDMWIFGARPPGPVVPLCRELHHPDLGEKLIHCSSNACAVAGFSGPRSETMRTIAGLEPQSVQEAQR